MSNVNKIYDDFALKLRQYSTIETLRKYILWQRKIRAHGNNITLRNTNGFPEGPVSINLDITTACNYSCGHCVDAKILNTGDRFTLDELYNIVRVLSSNGLKTVILIGGGEPLLHPQFESIVRYIKSFGLQLGISTNGSNTSKLINIADCLNERDWIRFSLDAGSDETFQAIHRPKKGVNLLEICSSVRQIKRINDKVSIGFSFIIFWEDCKIANTTLTKNVDEIPTAVELACQNGFDYITFKPCLVKTPFTFDHETLLYEVPTRKRKTIVRNIKQTLSTAKEISNGRIRIQESINLRAMLDDNLAQFKRQPHNCHSQVFRQIVTPVGIYHCPAFRGHPKAFIASKDGYISQQKFVKTITSNIELLFKFDASEECRDIVCFYNRLNWWVEDFINSGKDVYSLEAFQDENFFL